MKFHSIQIIFDAIRIRLFSILIELFLIQIERHLIQVSFYLIQIKYSTFFKLKFESTNFWLEFKCIGWYESHNFRFESRNLLIFLLLKGNIFLYCLHSCIRGRESWARNRSQNTNIFDKYIDSNQIFSNAN